MSHPPESGVSTGSEVGKAVCRELWRDTSMLGHGLLPAKKCHGEVPLCAPQMRHEFEYSLSSQLLILRKSVGMLLSERFPLCKNLIEIG